MLKDETQDRTMQNDPLREQYTIDTPENVTVGYTVAGIGSRFVGALIDTTLIVLALLALNIGVMLLVASIGRSGAGAVADAALDESDPGWVTGLIIALYALLNFAVVWGYYLGFELRWAGQSPGKRVAGTQVVRSNGAPAGFGESAIRNVVRLIDFLPFAYGVGLVTMICNSQARRLGDYAAGTLVVKVRGRIQLDQLAGPGRSTHATLPAQSLLAPAAPGDNSAPADDELALRYPHLRAPRESEHQLIVDVLRRTGYDDMGRVRIRRVAAAIAQRVGAASPTDDAGARRLLKEVSTAYQELGRKRS